MEIVSFYGNLFIFTPALKVRELKQRHIAPATGRSLIRIIIAQKPLNNLTYRS